ncbi:hypothetical protein CPB84DRAFT_1837553 [Gymnopilus junonius]|uniref:HNH nuclease domain-containing protein n=1 Tax=Gymnopilus junonius TaxID=109634 RepID=A0A9P5TJT0_GYMJU|nr:hypothetical protein CPB84DRAFT_1837553 [Gymnopilus junonius]
MPPGSEKYEVVCIKAVNSSWLEIYAEFPLVVELDGELNLNAGKCQWVQFLALPLERLQVLRFSSRPYKWIRYAIGIIVGAEGDLSFSTNSLDNVDYNAGLPTDSAVLYYHTSDEEKQRMFPVDPNMTRTNVTSSDATTRRAQFRSDIAERDGNECVLSRFRGVYCDAVHLLAHSKGDTYISTYTQHRSRDPAGSDLVQDIDSVRNGLFLNKVAHVAVGEDVAFLQTPNFAMDTSDVDPTAPPEEKRCTAQLFEPSDPLSLFFGGAPPSGIPIRLSDTPDWPPASLFDAVYATAVLRHFGAQELKIKVTTTWNDTFCPDGVMNQAHAEKKARNDSETANLDKAQQQSLARQARLKARAGRAVPDTLDMLMVLPYILVPPNELQATLRKAEEKALAAEQRRVQEKVNSWSRHVIP